MGDTVFKPYDLGESGEDPEVPDARRLIVLDGLVRPAMDIGRVTYNGRTRYDASQETL